MTVWFWIPYASVPPEVLCSICHHRITLCASRCLRWPLSITESEPKYQPDTGYANIRHNSRHILWRFFNVQHRGFSHPKRTLPFFGDRKRLSDVRLSRQEISQITHFAETDVRCFDCRLSQTLFPQFSQNLRNQIKAGPNVSRFVFSFVSP